MALAEPYEGACVGLTSVGLAKDMGVSKIRGPSIDPKAILGLLLQGHPERGPRTYRNSRSGCSSCRVLMRVDSRRRTRSQWEDFKVAFGFLSFMGSSREGGPSKRGN